MNPRNLNSGSQQLIFGVLSLLYRFLCPQFQSGYMVNNSNKQMKCTLSQAKENKIQKLTQENKHQQDHLQSLLQQSIAVAESIQACCSLKKSLEDMIQAERARASLLATNIAALSIEYIQSEKQADAQEAELVHQEQVSRELSQKLWKHTKKMEEEDAAANRLKAELKMYATMSKSSNNTTKKCGELQKNQECLVRTLAILRGKMESHRKYLAILHKQQDQKQEESKINSSKLIPSARLKNHNRTLNEENEAKCQAKTSQSQTLSVKQFDNINRRRNLIAMSKSNSKIQLR